MDKVYIQTYSVREMLEKDFAKSIETIAKIGYAGVELAGQYGGLSAAELKKLLDDNGLECISAHIGLEQAESYIDYIAELGAKYIICPSARIADYDAALKVAEGLNKVGEACAKAGMKYGFHNHTSEFRMAGDKYIEEVLIENTDPSKVIFQLDVGWCTTAGVNAAEFIKKHAGRFELIHAKEAGKVVGTDEPIDWSKIKFGPDKRPIFTDEMKAAMAERMRMNVPTGKGLIDWSEIKAVADAQGAKAYIVEREWDYAGDIFQCVKDDWVHLSRI